MDRKEPEFRPATRTLLTTNPDDILMAIGRRPDLKWPVTRSEFPVKPKSEKFCRFHNDYGHTTNECNHLKNEIERLIQAGHLKEYVFKDKEPRGQKRRETGQEEGPPRAQEGRGQPAPDPARRNVINMIVGGPTDGDSNRARKAHTRKAVFQAGESHQEIGQTESLPTMRFGPIDMMSKDLSHNDALVITATIASHDVKRIFIDTGSSADILFYECFKQMNLNVGLIPVDTSLFGFAGGAIHPMGQVSLTVAIGQEPYRSVKMIRFLVVDTPSAYNAIFGRPLLNTFMAVISTFHMKLKFPVGEEVGEAVGEERVARSCYEVSVKKSNKNRKKPDSPTDKEEWPEKKKVKIEESEMDPEDLQVEPEGEIHQIELVPGRADRTTGIGAHLKEDLKAV